MPEQPKDLETILTEALKKAGEQGLLEGISDPDLARLTIVARTKAAIASTGVLSEGAENMKVAIDRECNRIEFEEQMIRDVIQQLKSAGAEKLMGNDFLKIVADAERATTLAQELRSSVATSESEQLLKQLKSRTPKGWIDTTLTGKVADGFERAAPSNRQSWEPVLTAVGLRVLPESSLIGWQLRDKEDFVRRVEVVPGAPTGRDASVVRVIVPCLVYIDSGRPYRKAQVAAGGY